MCFGECPSSYYILSLIRGGDTAAALAYRAFYTICGHLPHGDNATAFGGVYVLWLLLLFMI